MLMPLNGLAYTKYLLSRPKFWSTSLYDQPLLRYDVVENWKNQKGTK